MLVEDVGVKRAEEEARGSARVGDPDPPGVSRAREVRLDDAERSPRRRVVRLAIERETDLGGAFVHVHGDHGRDDAGEKGDELPRELPQDDLRVFLSGQGIELVDRRRELDVARLHRLEEERLLRLDVPKEGGRRDVQLARDVGQRRRLEALPSKDAARHGEQLGPLDGCRASHL